MVDRNSLLHDLAELGQRHLEAGLPSHIAASVCLQYAATLAIAAEVADVEQFKGIAAHAFEKVLGSLRRGCDG